MLKGVTHRWLTPVKLAPWMIWFGCHDRLSFAVDPVR
jgi:hypothetical protein